MLWSVLSCFIVAAAAPWLTRPRAAATGWLFALLPLTLTAYFLGQLGAIADGARIVETHPWVPALGIALSFYLDGLSLLFALLIAGVGALVMIYSGSYLAGDHDLGRYYLFLTGFMGAMLGLVLAGNLITLFVFWELTSISSFFLIGYRHQEATSRAAALQALLVTSLGGLGLLAGFLLLGEAGGTLEIADLLGRGEAVRGHELYLPVLILILAGAFTKSAQFPFHFWLPAAMAAPTPISAYLHSVTMVKAGIYLLARLSPVLAGTVVWQWSLLAVGGITMLLGAVLAVGQSDLKRLLAYSTVNALGILVFLFGIDTETAVHAALVFLLVHALYKGALFLVAGVVDHHAGSRDIRRLRGLARQMPLIATASTLAALSMAGFPPLFGFISKETIYHVVLDAPAAAPLLTLLALISNILLVVAAALLLLQPFFGRPTTTAHAHGVPPALGLGPALLAGSGLAIGLFPWLIDARLLTPAAAAVLASPTRVKLALWHGVNLNLLLSLGTFIAGAAAYVAWRRWGPLPARWRRLAAWGPDRGYQGALEILKGVAGGQTRLLQSGRLNLYVLLVFAVAVGFAAFSLLRGGEIRLVPAELIGLRINEITVAALVAGSALLALFLPSRLGAIVAMGGVGYGVALLYLQFGAPDVAMTQFAVETITVVLFVLIIHRLPPYAQLSSLSACLRDGLIAVGAGGLMTVLVLAALTTGNGSRLAPFFTEQAVPLGKGHNIVNIILVDFRALDTLGEITVLAIAGIGVIGLLQLYPGRKKP